MNPFDHVSISRRDFVRLSTATGAALALPGNSIGETTASEFDDEYEYVLNHTPADHAVPTLVTFADASGPEAMDAAVATEVLTTTEPQPAAYGRLTAGQAQTVADLPSAEQFQFAPGSNPFWRISYYPLGVFPEPRRSVDYIGFEQLKDGLSELEDRYPDRVNVRVAGKSPGHTNRATDRPDPKQMLVVELTNDVRDREAFRAKEKVFHSCSLHGPERAGAEAGARVVENVARSSEPDIEGSDAKIEPLLDDVAVLIGFTNPDGWVARNPQYDSGWQFGGPGTDLPRIPAAPLYERGNAEVYDSNRQYPVVGQVIPSHYPAQPNDPASEDEETPTFVHEKVPDAKAFVDFFSRYENLNYGSDLHGGPIFNEFVLGLISQDQFDTRQIHELYEMCINIDETLEAALTTWTTAGDLKTTVLGDTRTGLLFGVLPEQAFDYSTIYDTIGYTVTGAFLDWMAHPEPIGLDLTTLDFEMAFSWAINGQVYNPEIVEMQVTGYRTAIRTITAFAVGNSDTPTTDDEFGARTETGGDSVAYITPGGVDAGALSSTDDELVFDDGGDGGTTGATTQDVVLAADVTELTFDVERADLHSLGVDLRGGTLVADVQVLNPDGEPRGEFEAVTAERAGGKDYAIPEFTVPDPEPGTWTVRVDNRRDLDQAAELRVWTLAASGTNPDPKTAWPGGEGFVQREYETTPFTFFDDYGEYMASGAMDAVSVQAVADGALLTDDGTLAYDHVVVCHDYGANADAEYIGSTTGYAPGDHPTAGADVDGYAAALDDYVDADGNLVLTDAGVNLVTALDNDLVDGSAIGREDVTVSEFIVPRFDGPGKNLGHPLFGGEGDVRPIQTQLWKVQPLGYNAGSSDANGQAPMFLPDESALGAAASGATATVAGRTQNQSSGEGGVAAASITPDDQTGTGVHLIASLLPPATQVNLHPFGLQDYTVTFLGYVMLTSALGFIQVRETGEEVRRYGRTDSWDTSGVEHLSGGTTFAASGSRSDDGSAFTGGQTNQVTITVDSLSAEAAIEDSVPDGWTVSPGTGDVVAVTEDNVVVLESVGAVGESDDPVTRTYFAEAPEGAETTNAYDFGPAVASQVGGEGEAQVAGTETNYVVGVGTSGP